MSHIVVSMHIAPKKDVADAVGLKSIGTSHILERYEWGAYFTLAGTKTLLTQHLIQNHGSSILDCSYSVKQRRKDYELNNALPVEHSMMVLFGRAGQGEILLLSESKEDLRRISPDWVSKAFEHPIALTAAVEGA